METRKIAIVGNHPLVPQSMGTDIAVERVKSEADEMLEYKHAIENLSVPYTQDPVEAEVIQGTFVSSKPFEPGDEIDLGHGPQKIRFVNKNQTYEVERPGAKKTPLVTMSHRYILKRQGRLQSKVGPGAMALAAGL